MICGACAHDNQENAKFCLECGAPLARRCSSCDTSLPPTAKFCDECGTAVAAAPKAPSEPATAPVRKRVTALFADLVGSTAFAERVDPEAARTSLAPYFELLQSTIDDHAGTVVKFTGDGLLAVFGLPEVAEDDALRAVTAGVDVQRRFRAVADDIRARHSIDLGLRIGVNTGELVIGNGDADMVGDVLNTAARLEAACTPGRVLVGESTWRLTRSSVAYEVLGEVRVKGKSEPIATFQVVEANGVSADVTPFVGRHDELDVLRTLFDDAVGASAARLATVIGDPGVGKTRLAHEVRSGSEARSFDLRLERRGSTTFAPIADLLREVTGSGSVEEVERLVDGHAEAQRLGPVLASFLGHGQPRTTEESFWAVRRLLELLSADGPLIVVVDDIQWAEPLFWDLLDHLVEWTAAPVLLIALARPELRELRPELTQPGRRVNATIALKGLTAETTLELAARLLEIDELPPELAERLPSSTDGNPLFVRELVQMLIDDGVLVRDGDRWHLTIDADAIDVPPTILSLLASRVERLPDDERQVVELASVIGTEFDRGTLAAVATGDVATRLGAVIDRLRRKDLIEPTGQWAGDHPVYRFHHVLIRDAAYRRLLKGHRAELHERVGRHVETTGIADDERDVIVAHHFEQVYQFRSELGAVDGHTRDLAIEAATRLRSAAELALGREDLASAGNAAIRALRLLDAEAGTDRDELLLIGCEALLSSADVARSVPLVEELHTRSADGRLAAWADCFRAQLWSLTAADRLTEAGELAAAAADRLAAIGDDAGVAKARLVRASCLARLGRVGDCEAELDLALGAARAAGDRRRTVAVLGAAPLAALWGPSPVARAGGRCLDVLRLLRITTASPTVEATSIRCQGMLEALRGRSDAARAKFETSRAMARELGLRHALFETELFAGLSELLVGDAIAAEPHLRAAHEGLGRLGIGADAGQAGALLARSLLLQGRVTEADELAGTALDTAGQNLQTAIASRTVLAEVRAAQSRHHDARVLVDEALSIVAPTDVTLDHALTLFAAARVALAAGDATASTRHRKRAAELLAAKGATLEFHEASPSGGTTDGPAPAHTTSPVPRAHRIWNHALEMAQRSSGLATAGDRDGFLACYAPDFVTVDHGASAASVGYAGRSDAASWADFAVWIMTQDEGAVGEPIPIAVRGAQHGLMRWTLRTPTTDLERLVVLASDGVVLLSAHFYDPDQLFEAIDELDRQWVAHDPTALPFSTIAVGNRVMAAVATGDPDAMRAALTADFVAIDHQQVGLGERRLDEWIATNEPSADGHALSAITAEYLYGDDQHCLARLTKSVGTDSWHLVGIMEVRDGRVSRVEYFHEDDIETATARYHELTPKDLHQRPFTNTAWEVGQLATEAFAQRDADALRELLAADFRAVWHERLAAAPLVTDREAFVEILLDVDGRTDPGERQVRLVAIRGDHLALTWNRLVVEGAEQFVRYRVNETVGQLLIGVEWFDEDQLDEAVAELDRRYLLLQGFAADHWIVTAWSRTYGTTGDEVLPHLHPDVEFVEHRRFHQLSGGAEDLLRSADAPNQGTAMVTQVFRVTERGAVFERAETEPNAPGEAQMLIVLGFADERIRHLEVFDTEALDEALVRYDELTAPLAPRELANTASRLAIAFTEARLAQDADRMTQLLSPDFVVRSHGRWMEWFPQVSGSELLDALEPGEGRRDTDVVAVRGDHLCLVHRRRYLQSGLETDARYFLIASDDQRITSIDWYDDSQHGEAFAELDRRYLISQGLSPDHWVVVHWYRGYGTSFDDFAPILHPEFEMTDHRRIVGMPSGGLDHLQHVLALSATESRISLPRILRISELGAVYEHLETAAAEAASVNNLMVLGFADERIRTLDLYDAHDPGDEIRALARYDEIVGRPGRGLSPNRAYRIADELARSTVRRDRDAMLAVLADDFSLVAKSKFQTALGGWRTMTRFETVDDLLVTYEEGSIASQTRRVVATRGDYLYLSTSTLVTVGGDELVIVVLGESDDTRLLNLTSFDESQFADAIAELDRRYRLACGIDDDHWVARYWDTLTSFDADLYDEIFTPDFQAFDHRAFTLGLTGRDEFLAWIRATPASSTWSVPVIHRLDDRAMVLEHAEMWADQTGESHMLAVIEFGDGLTTRIDTYDMDDLDAAFARYDEITRVSGRALSNGAWESARRRQDAQTRQDRAGFAAMFDADFVAEFHDPLMTGALGTAQFDKAGFLELVLHPEMTNEGAGSDMALIAIRGDDLCLYRVGMTSPGGDLTERLIVDAVHDGRCTRMDIFDPDQLIDAQLELDRRYRRSSGIGDDHWIAENWHVLSTTDFADIAPVLHPEFESVERRRLAWPNGNVDDWRAWMTPGRAALETTVPAMHRLCDRGVVTLRSERFEAGDLGVIDVVLVNEVEDGRVRRVISYEPENLDQALAEFDEFVARQSGHELTNAAWEIVHDAHLAKVSGDRDRYEAFFADDFVVTTNDSIMAQVHGGTYDKALWLEAAFDPLLFGPTSSQHAELIAVRGDDLCLFRSRVTTESGDLHERLNVLEVRDGSAVRMDAFAHDQLSEAQIALDRRWLASLGFAEDHPWFELVEFFYDGGSTVIARALSEHFAYLDHRKLSYPDGDRSQILTNADTLFEAAEVVIPRYLRLTDRLLLGDRIEQTVGGANQSPGLYVTVLGADGLIEHMEIFEIDDEAAAIACFDRLDARITADALAPASRPLTNRAWEITAAFNAAYVAGERDAIDRLVDPDGPVEYHLRLSVVGSGTVSDFLDLVLASHAEASENRQQLELVAVRGDHLCLVLVDGWYDDANLRYCLVVETDDERVTHMVWFDDDQLIDAQIELDRRWLAATGRSGHWFEPHWRELYLPQPQTMFEYLAPDFEYIDHRPLMYPSGDVDQLRSNIESMHSEMVFTIPRIHRFTDEGSVFERVETAVGEIGQTHVVFVSHFVDQRVRSIEAFDITQLDRALARYDDLAGG